MRKFNPTFSRFVFVLLILLTGGLKAQELKWSTSGESIYQIKANGITEYSISDQSETVVVPNEWLTPNGEEPLSIRDFSFYEEGQKLLIYTNTKRVWRLDTQGDYWVLDLDSKTKRKKRTTKKEKEKKRMKGNEVKQLKKGRRG